MSTRNLLLFLNDQLARKCTVCGEVKTLKESFNKSKGQTYGYFPQCKVCTAKDKKERGYKQADLRKNFGITLEEYNKILAIQNGLCAICRKTNKSKISLAVDHDHETNVVRGLLCSKCNTAIGLLNEDENIIWNMLEYLKKYVWLKAV